MFFSNSKKSISSRFLLTLFLVFMLSGCGGESSGYSSSDTSSGSGRDHSHETPGTPRAPESLIPGTPGTPEPLTVGGPRYEALVAKLYEENQTIKDHLEAAQEGNLEANIEIGDVFYNAEVYHE